MKAKIIIEVGDDSTEIEMTGSTFDLVKGASMALWSALRNRHCIIKKGLGSYGAVNGDMETLIHYGALALQTDWTTFRVVRVDEVLMDTEDHREAVAEFCAALEPILQRTMARRVAAEREEVVP